jgi:NAD-dependent dihydropyrimidine dehydrogenase PreA subunit
MAVFIRIDVAPDVAGDPERVKKLVEVCPVDIFASGDGANGGGLRIVDENVDECTLCELCLEVKGVEVVKLYDEEARLERS